MSTSSAYLLVDPKSLSSHLKIPRLATHKNRKGDSISAITDCIKAISMVQSTHYVLVGSDRLKV